MQLKLRRSQREGGMLGGTVIFCLDARAEYTREERTSIDRYKLRGQVIYNSEAAKKHLDKADAHQDGSVLGSLKGLGAVALAAMRLNISIGSLEKGHHIECKSLDELLGAEDAIMTACENLTAYLDTAASFDGREVVVDFSTGKAQAVAQATTPQPMPILPLAAAPVAVQEAVPQLITTQQEHYEQDTPPLDTYEPTDPTGDGYAQSSFTMTHWQDNPATYVFFISMLLITFLALARCS